MQRGFTLMEMVVATLILAIGVAGAMSALAASTRAAGVTERLHTASLLAQRRLTEIEMQSDTLSAGEQQGGFGEQYPDYRWRQAVEQTNMTDLFSVTVTVEWNQGGIIGERKVATFLRKPSQEPSATGQNAAGQTGQSSGGANNSGGGF